MQPTERLDGDLLEAFEGSPKQAADMIAPKAMPLEPGSRLGFYEILAPLGAGGMGEVYKARDTRLGRTVAVKILPKHIAQREDLRERFEREARAVSKLKHPHICVLHDISQHEDQRFMVLEYLEGETLAARLKRGALSIKQIVEYAIQIADALDHAHRSGVIHRDIKPNNVMLTREGAKVLDFGLAKTAPNPMSAQDATLTVNMFIGTPPYMAPEQIEGGQTDHRADVFGFGCVLYEMATGRMAFEGKTRSEVMAAILSGTLPPMTPLERLSPPFMERIVRRCLAKDPEDRWQSMRDVVLELKSIVAAPGGVPGKRTDFSRWRWLWAVALTASLLTGGVAVWLASRKGKPASYHVTVSSPETSRFSHSAVSPDGAWLTFVANRDGKNYLWVQAGFPG